MNIGIIANCEIRNNGTFCYAHRACKLLAEQKEIESVKHYQPRGEVGKHDWYLYVDDGRDDLQWLPPHPCAYWAIDTHLGYVYRLWKARHFDKVFVAQKDAVELMAEDGVKAQWLPLACHPEAHNTKEELAAKGFRDLDTIWDLAFVGYMNDIREPGTNNRVDYLDTLFTAYPNSWLSVNCFFEEMSLRYVKARLGFNLSVKRDLNMRVFEIMSTGTPLLTNRDVEGIDDLFVEGEDYIGFVGPDEMLKGVGEALADEREIQKIGRQGYSKVRSFHTYEHRMRTIIEEMNHV